jgi:hypothetical protein
MVFIPRMSCEFVANGSVGGFEGRLYSVDLFRECQGTGDRFSAVTYNRNIFKVISSVAFHPGNPRLASLTCDQGLFQVRDLNSR